MGNQSWYLTYFMTSQQQVHAEDPLLDSHLGSQYIKDKKIKTDLYGIFQSSNRSNFFMDFQYKKYAKFQKGCTYRMPVYGIKGHSQKITRMLNYSEVFFSSEEEMNAEVFNDLVFGTKYISEDEAVTDSVPVIGQVQEGAASRTIAAEDVEAVSKVLEKLWEAQEGSPDTRFIILMDDAENKSMELLRELYLMIPNRLRLQMGFQTNVTQADLNQIRDNNGLPIYVLTAEKSEYKELTEKYSFPIVVYDMTQPEAYTYDQERLSVIENLAKSMDGKTITKLSYTERKVIETKEGSASSFKYYREVLTEMDNDRLYWWKNKEIASVKDLTAALEDQDELMRNPELLDEGLLAFFKKMVPEGTYAEEIIALIRDEQNPDRDAILESLGSRLHISKEIDAVKALVDKMTEERAQAVAEKEAAEREQKARELAAQQQSYEEQIKQNDAKHKAELEQKAAEHAAEIKSLTEQQAAAIKEKDDQFKAQGDKLTSTQKALDEKTQMFDKICETNKSNIERAQALEQTVAQKDSDIAELQRRMGAAGTQNVEALQDDLEKAEKKVKRTVAELEETQGKKKLFTILTSVFGVLTAAGVAAAVIFMLKAGAVSGLQKQIDELTSSQSALEEQLSEAEVTGAAAQAELEQKLSEKQSELDSIAAAESERISEEESAALAAESEAVESVTEGEAFAEGGETVVTDGENGPEVSVNGEEQPVY